MASREEIRARDSDRCCRCGRGGPLHVHHRVRRSQGGTNDPQNLVSLCPEDHDWVHHHPMAARREGLLLSRGTDPGAVPIDHHMFPAGPVLLGPDLTFVLWAA